MSWQRYVPYVIAHTTSRLQAGFSAGEQEISAKLLTICYMQYGEGTTTSNR